MKAGSRLVWTLAEALPLEDWTAAIQTHALPDYTVEESDAIHRRLRSFQNGFDQFEFADSGWAAAFDPEINEPLGRSVTHEALDNLADDGYGPSDWKKRTSTYLKAWIAYPNPDVLLKLADLLAKRGCIEEAKRAYEVLLLFPGYAPSFYGNRIKEENAIIGLIVGQAHAALARIGAGEEGSLSPGSPPSGPRYAEEMQRKPSPEPPDPLADLRRRADAGDADGQFNLGYAYANSEGVPQDYAEAAKWYRKAADQAHSSAQNSLGHAYLNGLGVSQDGAEAVKWFRRAAEQGNAAGQFNLGYAYAEGEGVPQDQAEAVKWYRKAADRGDADAQVEVGIAYYEGRGVRRNSVQSYKWLTLASSKPCSVDRDVDPPSIEEVASKMTPQQIAKAQRLAKEWKPNGSE